MYSISIKPYYYSMYKFWPHVVVTITELQLHINLHLKIQLKVSFVPGEGVDEGYQLGSIPQNTTKSTAANVLVFLT